jgi:membrane protease YdiL (CAAX protease family)
MHVVLWTKLGPATLVIVFLAGLLGLIAGYYREKTGSLIPAILIHAFFDIGGTLPIWISVWLHQGRS